MAAKLAARTASLHHRELHKIAWPIGINEHKAKEEVILRGTQDGKSELNFIWLFTGKADSGGAPKISIEMEASDGNGMTYCVHSVFAVADAMLTTAI